MILGRILQRSYHWERHDSGATKHQGRRSITTRVNNSEEAGWCRCVGSLSLAPACCGLVCLIKQHDDDGDENEGNENQFFTRVTWKDTNRDLAKTMVLVKRTTGLLGVLTIALLVAACCAGWWDRNETVEATKDDAQIPAESSELAGCSSLFALCCRVVVVLVVASFQAKFPRRPTLSPFGFQRRDLSWIFVPLSVSIVWSLSDWICILTYSFKHTHTHMHTHTHLTPTTMCTSPPSSLSS